MKKEDLFIYAFVGFVGLLCLKIYYESDAYNLKCIISGVDGNRYCVRERQKLELAADLLAKTTSTCKKLVDYMETKYPNDERTQRLVSGFDPTKISETLPTSELTAYTENKGEKIAFCLNRTKNGNKLIDEHTLTFVAIHELAHIMTKSVGHGQEFWTNFKYLLEKAEEGNIYKSKNYKNDPQPYCGIDIRDNPYYDLT
jgi:hypothetical protein